MQSKFKTCILAALVVAGSAMVTTGSIAQNFGDNDPPRWTQENQTPQARYKNSVKEAKAGYQEALNQCKGLDRAERSGCVREARANYRNDMEEAKRRLSE